MRYLFKQVLAKGGIRALLPFSRSRCHLIMFHGLTDHPPLFATEDCGGKHIHVDDFRRVLQWLKTYFTVVPLEAIVAALEEGKDLPPNSIALTFDDGYESNYTLAYPVLRELGLPATIFLATRFIEERQPLWTCRVEYAVGCSEQPTASLRVADTIVSGPLATPAQRIALVSQVKQVIKAGDQSRIGLYCETLEEQLGVRLDFGTCDTPCSRPLSWGQIREMAAGDLISFGGHGHNHVILGHCPDDVVREEAQTCWDLLRQRLGGERRTFAYPNGTPGDYRPNTHELLAQAGFSCALSTVEGSCVPGLTRAFGAPRIAVCSDTEPWSLVGRMLRRRPVNG